jgi:dihydroorotate dehydrogenase
MMPYQTLSWGSFSWRGLEFTNPLGIAGGIDKDAVSIQDWWTLGPGFIEIGTITPRPQRGHTGRRLARHLEHRALWNRMGFPSQGVEAVIKRLKRLYQPRFTPVFANIGKNATTPIESAVDDYLTCLHLLNGLVDGFVINLSSPNTPGLRDLLSPDRLRGFLEPLIAGSRETHGKRASDRATPILLKLSPDVSPTHLEEIVLVAAQLGIDGFVVANSSTSLKDQFSFAQDGGVSGAPLAPLARDMLALTIKALGANRQGKLIISCGGVMTPQDVFERLSLGADLVQVYSALIFEGPFFFRKVANQAPERFQ